MIHTHKGLWLWISLNIKHSPLSDRGVYEQPKENLYMYRCLASLTHNCVVVQTCEASCKRRIVKGFMLLVIRLFLARGDSMDRSHAHARTQPHAGQLTTSGAKRHSQGKSHMQGKHPFVVFVFYFKIKVIIIYITLLILTKAKFLICNLISVNHMLYYPCKISVCFV